MADIFNKDHFFTNIDELKKLLTIGSGIVSAKNMRILKSKNDLLDFIPEDVPGVFFVFSNYPKSLLNVRPGYDWRCWEKPLISANNQELHCLYNGKANRLQTRLLDLLFKVDDFGTIAEPGTEKKKIIGTRKSFHDGIDLSGEKNWGKYTFGVIILKVDQPFISAALEALFIETNGRPPLVSRIG